MQSYRDLTVERREHVALVTLDRPDRYNALSLDLLEQIERLCAELSDEPVIRAVVWTGAGKHFSAGADLKDERAAGRQGEPLVLQRRSMRLGQRVIRAIYDLDAITIAAINGLALGGAACIATAADLRIGADDCAVGYPEIDLGMNLSWLGLPLCVRLVGPARAKRMVILGRHEGAETLERWGFLDEVVPAATLVDRALEVAAAYAAKPPAQSQMIKRSVNALVSALDPSIMHMEFDQFLLAASTDDAREARTARVEKREAKYRGE